MVNVGMLDSSIFAGRRQQLLEKIGPRSLVLLGSPPSALRNGDADYPYRQSSDLFYLTGFDEPESTMILCSGQDDPFHLFVRPSDPTQEIWHGRRAGLEGACSRFGADKAYESRKLQSQLLKLLSKVDDFYYTFGENESYDKLVIKTLRNLRNGERRGLKAPIRILDPGSLVHEMRLHKSEEELVIMRRAAEISRKAHIACMKEAAPGGNEAELAALLDYTFRRNGGTGPGYTSIVGGGANATILHYIDNQSPLVDGELLLIDAGCEVDFYTADVTRTFPINGTFSPAQKRCYELVLKAENEAIEMIRPGVTLDQLHEKCVAVISAGLVELGLDSGDVESCISEERYKKFFMHKSSHWLGMDVHDVGAYNIDGKARPLAPGMVITVEPGLYIAGDADVAAEYRGIGIRIEDDILVTEEGFENLSAAIPRTVSEVEKSCR